MEIAASLDALYPAVGMHSLGEEVLLDLNAEWGTEEDDGQMIVDSHEDDWSCLHDVRLTGTVSVTVKKIVSTGVLSLLLPAVFPLSDDSSAVFFFDSAVDSLETAVELASGMGE